jgi:hypothetical protein
MKFINKILAGALVTAGLLTGSMGAAQAGGTISGSIGVGGVVSLSQNAVQGVVSSQSASSGLVTTYVTDNGYSAQNEKGVAVGNAGLNVVSNPGVGLNVETFANHSESSVASGTVNGSAPGTVGGLLANAATGTASNTVASNATATLNRVDYSGSVGISGFITTKGIAPITALQALNGL